MRSEQSVISVIVPVYHVEKYLNACVKSIIVQSYKNLEIILVDDGSDDSCPHMCDEWKKRDKRIKVIHKANGGLSDARNAGLEIASGSYIAFVDSDDLLHEHYIEELYNVIKTYDCEIAICKFEKFVDESKISNTKLKKCYTSLEPKDCYVRTDAVYDVAWNKLYGRDVIGNIRYPVKKLHEDMYTTYKFIMESKKIGFTTDVLYYYRQRSDSIIGKQHNYPSIDMETALWERLHYFQSIDIHIYNEAQATYVINVSQIIQGVKKKHINVSKDMIRKIKKRMHRVLNQLIWKSNIVLLRKLKVLSLGFFPDITLRINSIFKILFKNH